MNNPASNTSRTNAVETLIEQEKPITLDAIVIDINEDNWNCLYFASEAQIHSLITQNRIDEDFSSRHQDYQEEMRVLVHEG
jgi:hypothetical protein